MLRSEVPIHETLGAMEELVEAGKVRFIGVSNFSRAELKAAQQAMRKYRIVSNQVRYSLVDRTIEAELLSYCQANQVSVIAYSPLARGLPRLLDCDPKGILAEIAQATGKTRVQVAINWLLCKDGVFAIPKGNSIEHVVENCGASGWRLGTEHLRLLEENIKCNRRSHLQMVLRRLIPSSLSGITLKCINALPRSLKRRFR